MPQDSVDVLLPNGSSIKVTLYYLGTENSGCPLYYPQAVRAWPAKSAETCGATYGFKRNQYAAALCQAVSGQFDAICAPPSRYEFAAFYKDELAKHLGSTDISSRFSKDLQVTAGEGDASLQDVYDALTYSAQGDEPQCSSVLIVDDVFATGKTTGAVLGRLIEAGMKPDAQVSVVTLLRIRGKEAAPTQGDATG